MKTAKSTSKKSLAKRLMDSLVSHPEVVQGLLALSGNATTFILK